jgi:hypothetical protein
MDILSAASIVVLFASGMAYVYGCDHLKGSRT